jgi:aminopeptidase N
MNHRVFQLGLLSGVLCLAGAGLARPTSEICHAPFSDETRQVPGFDPVTGKSTWTFPPHPFVDFKHMKLAIDIADMNVPRFAAVQTLVVQAIGEPISTLSLDAHLLEIQTVTCDGHNPKFTNDGRTLTITFDPPLTMNAPAQLVTSYAVNDPPMGITWTPESPAWPGRPAQLHSQGESDTNSYWFPCHDFPNVKLTTELLVTVPAGYTVSSNGREAEPVRHEGSRDTFHWLQDKPHVNYLVSLVVGKFDIVDVAPRGSAVPMPVYVPPGRGGDVVRTFGRTPRMVELFGKLTGQPYAWDRYAQVLAWNFGAGGMENTSATTLYDTAVLDAAAVADGYDQDGLISHELAHQWFGDLITCRSWDHIWLNEGFATYFSNLWFESRDGIDAYQAGVRGNFDSVLAGDHADAPYQRAMVSKNYRDPDDMFGGAANPYPKGSSILHMLRMRLGDDLFFKGLAQYVAMYRFKNAETNDLRRVMEDVSGESLDRFFRQWCERPGVPDLDVNAEWDAKTSELVVTVKQTQTINGDNPAFAFELPVWVNEPGASTLIGRKAGAGARRVGTVWCESKSDSGRFKLAAEPRLVAIDPNMTVLARMTIHQPTAHWIEQLDLGPTWAARIQAARNIDASPPALMMLGSVARNAKADPHLRAEAIQALTRHRAADAVIACSAMPQQPVDVTLALLDAAADLGGDAKIDSAQRARFKDFIANRAGSGANQRVRAAAIEALGKLKAADRLALVLAAAADASQHDRVRQAAIGALERVDAAEGLAVAVHFAQAGSLNRTRPGAIAAVASLAHHDEELAFRTLVAQLPDHETRAWHAAGEALVKLADNRSVPEFEKLLASKKDPRDKELIEKWIAALKPTTEPAKSAP